MNGDGVSKLTDFGIAARTGEHPVPAGTLNYAAPEQIAGAPASPASDIYAATATFCECLTGHPPVTDQSVRQPGSPDAGQAPRAEVPEALGLLVAAGLAREPVRRPTDALTFVNELSAAASKAYGRNWADRGRSHLAEAALLLSALWPSGPPPAAQGSTAYQVPLRRRPRIRHLGAIHAAVGAAAVVAAAAAVGAALTAPGPGRPAANVQPLSTVHSVRLRLSSSTPGDITPSPRTDKSPSPTPQTGNSVNPPPTQTTAPTQTAPTSQTSPPPVLPPPVPVITGASTYTQGVFVYVSVTYSDPGNDAEGFGFVGVDGSGWAEENHPFSSPSYGIVGSDSIAYPFNSGCGTSQQYGSYVEVWIYDTAGARSDPVTLHLVCSGGTTSPPSTPGSS